MKKYILFFVLTLVVNVNGFSQRMGVLGNLIIEQDNFMSARDILLNNSFTLTSDIELRAFDHNPETEIIAYKGDTIMVYITANKLNSRIKNVVFNGDATFLNANLTDAGYKVINSRRHLNANKINNTEVTYKRSSGKFVDVVIVKYSESKKTGGIKYAEVTFKRTDK